ncbi:MAG TPA: carboxypeptidase regulatory-like domain-containing protein [Gemmatimonadaceae bacterium]|nr:carboxypeptidase regulatory-like domain-containing protein [Gemmatimonadaceae bacterium]
MASVRLLAMVVVAAVMARGSDAQQPAARTLRPAVLAGVVLDSIRGGYLRGASVFISGTGLSATTDSLGRFRIDGIPAGARVMEVQHPLLDSLAIALTTTRRIFNDGDSSFVMLSVPSPRTYAASTCTPGDAAKGPSLIVGTVTDAATGRPSAGASVSVSWTDYEVGRKSILSLPQHHSTQVSAEGNFRICGLPEDLTAAAVVASRASDSTAAVEVNLVGIVATVALKLPAPRAASVSGTAPAPDTVAPSPTQGTSFISGRVFTADGAAAGNARVAVEDDDAVVNTKSDGTFTLSGVRPGTRRLTVRKIGFEPFDKAVEISADGTTDVRLVLGKSVAVLKNVVVRAVRDFGLQRVGFTERKSKRSGYFIDPNMVDLRNGPPVGQLVRTLPISRRPGCMRYFIDGHLQAAGSDPDEYLSGSEVGAVEVYSSGFVPAEFVSFTATGRPCTTVVIWTKWKLSRR